METILASAQALVYALLDLMPSSYQSESLQSTLSLFLEAQGHPLPEHCKVKSPSALSRFLNEYQWSTRQVIRVVRGRVLQELLQYAPRGRRPWLQLIVDLTTLEKCGKFKAFAHLIQILNGKRGLQVVFLYLVVGQFRVPWGFRIWRGKGTASPAELALRLLDTLPQSLLKAYRTLVLADTGFGSVLFIEGVKRRGHAGIIGVRCDRRLADGRSVQQLVHKGQHLRLDGLKFPVSISWLYLKRDGQLEKRFVISTRPLKGSTITWWGRRRWAIEGFFKTVKHRFGLHCFGQQTLLGVYRWLVLSLISFLLAHWMHGSTGASAPPDWGEAAALALATLFPAVLVTQVLLDLERRRPLLHALGFDLQLVEMQI
jgi:hypothetical protein